MRYDLRNNLTQLPLGFMVEFARTGALIEADTPGGDPRARLGASIARALRRAAEQRAGRAGHRLGRLALMGDRDADSLREVSHGQKFETAPKTLADLVCEQAARTPDALAVVYQSSRLTYRDINEASNRMAHWLIERGIGSEDRVAVLLDKSADLVVTALGVAKAGAVYVPVDPTYPQDRLAFILGDCDAKLVLREPVGELPGYRADDPTDADRVRPLRPDNTAYLIYTSGTTGLPKGVAVPHRPVAEYFVWFKGEYARRRRRPAAAGRLASFDVSIAEIFGMLGCGARMVIPRPGGLNDIGYLTDLLHAEGITANAFRAVTTRTLPVAARRQPMAHVAAGAHRRRAAARRGGRQVPRHVRRAAA